MGGVLHDAVGFAGASCKENVQDGWERGTDDLCSRVHCPLDSGWVIITGLIVFTVMNTIKHEGKTGSRGAHGEKNTTKQEHRSDNRGDFGHSIYLANTWVQKTCNIKGVNFIDNFNLFWGNRQLFKLDGLHLNKLGARVLKDSMYYSIILQ